MKIQLYQMYSTIEWSNKLQIGIISMISGSLDQ